MNTEPEYTKPAWAPECPYLEGMTRQGWLAAEAAIYAAMEREKTSPRSARKQPRKRIKVTKYWNDEGPCLIVAGSHDETCEIAAPSFEPLIPYWQEDDMDEAEFNDMPEFEG